MFKAEFSNSLLVGIVFGIENTDGFVGGVGDVIVDEVNVGVFILGLPMNIIEKICSLLD